MLNTNITSFRRNVFSLLEQTVRYNEPLCVSTKDGNAIVISEEDYRSLMETVNILSVPGMREKLLAAQAEPLSDSVSESELEW